MQLALPAPPTTTVPVTGSHLHFPVRRIYCVGRNYAEHIREMGGDEREAPFFFQKPADALVTHGAVVPYPPLTSELHHEVELVLAIGGEGADVALDQARALVWGLGVGIDLTRRDLQAQAKQTGRPWEIGKAFDHSAPCSDLRPCSAGQALPRAGAITLRVNGALRQTGDLAQLIWSCDEVVAQLSRQVRLKPGDLIFTGTPAGVGPVLPGDRLDAEVDGVGRLSITIGPR